MVVLQGKNYDSTFQLAMHIEWTAKGHPENKL